MIQLSATANEAQVYRAHAARLGLRDNFVWPFVNPWDVVGFAHNSQCLECCGPHGELFFFFIRMEPFVFTWAEFRPCDIESLCLFFVRL